MCDNRDCLLTALETGRFELSNTQVNQNLVLHHLKHPMHTSMLFLKEACCMVGSPYRPADLQEISWRDLEMARRISPDAMEDTVERGSHSNPNQVDDGAERTSG